LHPARLEQLVAMAKPPAPPVKVGRRIPVAAARPIYVLEVIQGTQKTVHKFDESKNETGKQQ